MVTLISLVFMTVCLREQEALPSSYLLLPLLGQACPHWVVSLPDAMTLLSECRGHSGNRIFSSLDPFSVAIFVRHASVAVDFVRIL